MSHTEERRPDQRSGAQAVDQTRTSVQRPGDAAQRRMHWRHVFVVRRRIARVLDELCAGGVDQPENRCGTPVPELPTDYWLAVGMTLGVPERESAGRELTAAGWVA